METFLQASINSLSLGSVYALIALGLTLVFAILRIINFAHGQLFMIGAFVVLYFYGEFQWMAYIPALILAGLVVGIIGMGIERGFFARLRGQELPSMVLGLGLLLLLESMALLIFGEKDQYVPIPWAGAWDWGLVRVQKVRVLIFIVAVIFMIVLFLFLQKVKAGRAMRAVAQDMDASYLQGINVSFINTLGFGVGALMAAVGGGLLITVTKANPFIGQTYIIKAFIIVILGGMGSLAGSMIGALMLGIIDSFGQVYWGEGAPLISYVAVIIILVFRPRGLMGHAA
jgi:branched-chain amino acid transport system permease protein